MGNNITRKFVLKNQSTILYLINKDKPRFSWGKNNLVKDSVFRDQYLKALRSADMGDYTKLIIFADS